MLNRQYTPTEYLNTVGDATLRKTDADQTLTSADTACLWRPVITERLGYPGRPGCAHTVHRNKWKAEHFVLHCTTFEYMKNVLSYMDTIPTILITFGQ